MQCQCLMHGSETWTFRRKDERRLKAAEVRFLRCHRNKERQNKVTARKEEAGQRNTRK
jgi:hypothetical protein